MPPTTTTRAATRYELRLQGLRSDAAEGVADGDTVGGDDTTAERDPHEVASGHGPVGRGVARIGIDSPAVLAERLVEPQVVFLVVALKPKVSGGRVGGDQRTRNTESDDGGDGPCALHDRGASKNSTTSWTLA